MKTCAKPSRHDHLHPSCQPRHHRRRFQPRTWWRSRFPLRGHRPLTRQRLQRFNSTFQCRLLQPRRRLSSPRSRVACVEPSSGGILDLTCLDSSCFPGVPYCIVALVYHCFTFISLLFYFLTHLLLDLCPREPHSGVPLTTARYSFFTRHRCHPHAHLHALSLSPTLSHRHRHTTRILHGRG